MRRLADATYGVDDLAAAISSGSFRTIGNDRGAGRRDARGPNMSQPTTFAISSAVSAGNVPFISATTAARSLASGTTPRHTA